MFEFFIHVASMAAIYGLLALSLNMQVGYTGLINFGQIVLFACGTYGAALAYKMGWNPIFGLAIGIGFAAAMGLLFARLGKSLSSDYWGIATLSIAEITRIIITNEQALTGGAQGISGLPVLFGGFGRPYDQLARLGILALLLLVGYLFCRRLTSGSFGLSLKLMREEPLLASAMGHDLAGTRRVVMVVSGAIAAIAGFFFAHYLTFVGPDQMVSSETFLIWSMVIIGGLGNNLGVIAGAILLQFAMAYVPFVKDALGLPADFVAAARLTIVGGGILLFLLWRPAGLFPERVGASRK